jgi:hypothetical protein
MKKIPWTNRATTFSLAAVALFTATMASASFAQAAVPEHGSYTFTDSFIDPDYCDFPLSVTQEETGHYAFFFNPDGSDKRLQVHRTVTFTISANGHTLHESDHFTSFIAVDGSAREVGLFAHIQGDHGLVIRDAGQLVFDADDTLIYVKGPHPQFLGETFCSALLP